MKLKIGYFSKTNNNDEKISIRQFFKDTFINIKVLRKIKKIYKFVFLFSGINFYSAAMHALFLVLIVKTGNLVFVNIAYTIMFLELAEIISMILGGVYQLKFYKNMSLKNNVIIEMFVFILYIINIMYLQDKILLVALTIVIGYLAGISNPKLDALILQAVPEDKQTSIFSIFSTLITITLPMGTAIILFISNIFSITLALYCLLILLLILTIYSFNKTLN